MSRRSLRGKRTLITGASSGIGRELAVQLARKGARLLLTARRRERLEALAQSIATTGASVQILAGDIADADHRDHLLQEVQRSWGGLDLLVNNAGIGALGTFAQAQPQRLRKIMEVNFFAPAELIRGAVPLLRAGEQPMIVNISSVLGHRAVPLKSEYCASKFALHGLSDALRAEFTEQGIEVLLVSPSTTATEFFDSVVDSARPQKRSPTAGMPVEKVARRTIRAIRRGRHEIVLSAGGKLLVWLDRLCPPLVDRLVARFGK
jgi:short-subunit dehydrogenase